MTGFRWRVGDVVHLVVRQLEDGIWFCDAIRLSDGQPLLWTMADDKADALAWMEFQCALRGLEVLDTSSVH